MPCERGEQLAGWLAYLVTQPRPESETSEGKEGVVCACADKQWKTERM
jgi:hypothetical protein